MGLRKSQRMRMKGLLVISDEEILNTSMRSLRKCADSTSKGVDRKAMPAASQCFLRASNSFFQKESCRLNSSYWLLVGSLLVSQ